jgi:hypothetical protein
MLKEPNIPKEAEARAYEALRGLLEKIPILQVEGIEAEVVSGDWEPDLIAPSASTSRTGNHGMPGPQYLSCATTSRTEPPKRRLSLSRPTSHPQ